MSSYMKERMFSKTPYSIAHFSLTLSIIFITVFPLNARAINDVRKITHIRGDVYRFDNDYHSSMFVLTPEGIVVTDPINFDAAEWLKEELTKRFKMDAKYLVMSHYHDDHASGGEVFDDTVTVIAHKNFVPHMEQGAVDTAMPDITFDSEMELRFGGKIFELTYLGIGHSDDLIAIVVRPENIAFVVDAVTPRRLLYRTIPAKDINALIEQIKVVESLNFDILLPGHFELGTKQDATELRIYIETLRDRVSAELAKGKTKQQIVESVTMEEYKHWGMYDEWIQDNVSGMVIFFNRKRN